MAYESWPNTAHNSRAVTLPEHEQLTYPIGSDGLTGYDGTTDAVFADSTGLQVKIPLGISSWQRGSVFVTTSETIVGPLTPNSSGSTRVDLLVFRLNRSTYEITPVVIDGAPGAAAPAPVRDDNYDGTGFWDLPVAEITVINGATTITAAQVKLVGWYLGADGQIICTETSRPPHFVGRRIFQVGDPNITLESNGSEWVGVGEDSGWVTIPPNTGWTASSGFCRARRFNGATYLLLHFTRSGAALAAGTNSVMGGVPAGFRPDTGQSLFFAGVNSAGTLIRGFIATNGAVTIDAYSATFNTGSVFTHCAPIVFPSTV